MLNISIVIPVLNEAKTIGMMLKNIQNVFGPDSDIIIVDGGSSDETVTIAKRYSTQVIVSEKGRAKQMNAGAIQAKNDILLFLHADTMLPKNTFSLISKNMINNDWGYFNIRLSGNKKRFRIIEFFINWRSRLSSVATGDQALFINRGVFQKMGGFANIPLMEDIEMSKRLKQISKPVCLQTTVITSSRRWEKYGILSTVILMWKLRFLYFMGVSPERLAKLYK